ncbi:unnamed protein product [Ectocarpus sp. 12 AP-2014]
MMDPTTAKLATTACKHRKDGQKFLTAVVETSQGIDVSVDSEELAGHVDEHFDGHAEGGKAIVEGFKRVSEHISDEGENVDDGILEDSAEAIVGAVESVANNEIVQNAGEVVTDVVGVVHDALREGVKKGTEVVHGAARAMNKAGGVTSGGIPDIEGVEERAERYAESMETQAEGLADSAVEAFDRARENAPGVLRAVDPDGTLEEAVEEVAQEVGEAVAEILGGEVAEEALEAAVGSIPVAGALIPSYYLIHGGVKAAAGVTSLTAAGTMALVGGVYGIAAAPFDGGASWGKVANASRRASVWGASMGAEGGLIAAKGAMGFADQVAPGSQLATVPAKVACKMGANSINQMRNSSREVDARGDDDFEGAVTEEMVQTGKSYEIFSADGTRLVRASNTKSSRCNKFFGYAWGGYGLTFERSYPSPPSAAETQEPSPPSSAESQEDQEEDEGQQEEQEVQQEHQHGQHEEQQEREGPSASSPSSAAVEKKTQEDHEEREEESSSSFSFSGSPGAYRLHSDMHGGNTLFFLGQCYPAEWVVWDVGGKTDGAWERLELRWQEGGKKFTISGHGGQHVRWKDADGVFRGTRSESKATEFVLKEKISSATGNDASSTNGSSSSSSSSSSS